MLKKVLLVVIIFLIIFLPLILLSNCSLGTVQYILDSNKDKPWAADWQKKLGGLYQITFREEQAAEVYKLFMERYPNHPLYADVKFAYADCLSVLKGRKEDAIKELEEFIEWYPDHPLMQEVSKKLNRLKYASF